MLMLVPTRKLMLSVCPLVCLARADASNAECCGLGPGQYEWGAAAGEGGGAGLPAQAAGLPGGPAETGPACPQATEQGTFTFTFRAFSRRFKPKQLTIITSVRI